MKRILAVIFLIVALAATTIVVVNYIDSARTNYWLHRAQVAGNPSQTAEYLMEYKGALYENNLVTNRYSTIFRYPASSIGQYIRVIDGLAERALALSTQDHNAESYQMGLINLETDVNDLFPIAFLVWGASGGFVLQYLIGLGFLGAGVVGFKGIIDS